MEKIVYEYSVLRYVPDVERGEFVNVGLMMMCKRFRWLKTRIHIDEARLKALYRECDLERLKCQLRVFEGGDVPSRELPVEERYRWMAAVKSAIIQCTPSHPGVAAMEEIRQQQIYSLELIFDRLYNQLVQ